MNASYGWLITQDHQAEGDEPNNVGVSGPRSIDPSILERLNAGEGKPFRMFDDDAELYYAGRLIGGTGMEPLDDFGAPNDGCTSIHYQDENGVWKPL